MSFPLEKHEDWHDKYDHVKFPADGKPQSCKDVIPGRAQSPSRKVVAGRLCL